MVGAGVGGALLLVLLLLLVCRLRRHRQSRVAFMSEAGEQITAGSMRSVDTRSSFIRGETPTIQVPRLVVAIRASKRVLGATHTRRTQPITDSKTLAAARHAMIDAASEGEARGRGTPIANERLSFASPEARISGTPAMTPRTLSESEQEQEEVLRQSRGVDQDPYFRALHAERERVDAELARLREEYADGAPPTYISNNGSSGGAPTDQAADDISCEAPEELRVSTVRGDKT
jgi:hypothetical protein